jgi:hypothetical protein
MIAAEFVFRTMQLANLLAGCMTAAIGLLLAYDAWQARRRRHPAMMTVRLGWLGVLLILVGAVPVLAFYPRLAEVRLLWLTLSDDSSAHLSALGAMFSMFAALGVATSIGSRKPRRVAIMWMILLAGAFAATALQNVA